MVGKENEALSNFLTKEWLQQVHHPGFGQYGIRVDILRLDRIHPMVSGNKWLKLQYWLEKYRSGSYQGILTAGGPWSNHLHACAFACRTNHIPMKAVVKAKQGMMTSTLSDLELWGSEILYAHRQAFYDKSFWQQKAQEWDCLFIPMGGEGSEGKQGVTEWFHRLPLSTYDATFVSAGTGTTLEGIAESEFSAGDLFVSDPGTGDKNLKSFCQGVEVRTGKKIKYMTSENKFGHFDARSLAFLQDWYRITKIPLDFVYTAPLCQTLLKLVSTGQFGKGKRVLLVHTGGLQGNRSHKIVFDAQ